MHRISVPLLLRHESLGKSLRALEHAAKARETIRASMHARSSRSHRKLIQPSDAAPRMMSGDQRQGRQKGTSRVQSSSEQCRKGETFNSHASFVLRASTYISNIHGSRNHGIMGQATLMLTCMYSSKQTGNETISIHYKKNGHSFNTLVPDTFSSGTNVRN